jgi:hypothetical protein
MVLDSIILNTHYRGSFVPYVFSLYMAALAPIFDPPVVLLPLVGGRRIPIVYAIGTAIANNNTLAVTGLAIGKRTSFDALKVSGRTYDGSW